MELQERAKIEQQAKSAAEEMKENYEKLISSIKADWEVSILKIKTYANEINAKAQAAAQEKENFYVKFIAEIKARAEESERKLKALYEERITKIKTEAEEDLAKERKRAGTKIENILADLKAEFALKEEKYKEEILKVRLEAITKEKARSDEPADMMLKKHAIANVAFGEQGEIQQQANLELQERARFKECLAALEGTVEKIKTESKEKENFYNKSIADFKMQAELSTANMRSLFAEQMAAIKSDALWSITKEKARVEELDEMQLNAKTILKEKTKFYEEQLSKIKQELGIKIIKTKVEANKALAGEQIRIKELENQIIGLSGEFDLSVKRQLGHGEKLTSCGSKIDNVADIEKFAKKISSYSEKDFAENSTTTSNIP